jgi:hypothetical protein
MSKRCAPTETARRPDVVEAVGADRLRVHATLRDRSGAPLGRPLPRTNSSSAARRRNCNAGIRGVDEQGNGRCSKE